MSEVDRDPWAALAARTPARVALGRAGVSLPTTEVLRFALAHARARDAVHAPFDAAGLAAGFRAAGHMVVEVASDAPDRATYLRRPDRGRRLSQASARALGPMPGDLAIVVADGLSAVAVERQAPPLVAALVPRLVSIGLSLGPFVVATGARVALGDEIGARLGARAVLVLVGERPGLSSPDSLGAYLTLGPRPGRTDAERNCVSNIRPEGLGHDLAAFKLAWLVGEAFARGATGVALKDESDRLLVDGEPPPPRLGDNPAPSDPSPS